MKIVINTCYGGFSLSHEAEKRLCQSNPELFPLADESYYGTGRSPETRPSPHDPDLVEVRTLGRWPEPNSLFASYHMNGRVLVSGRDIARDHPALIQLVEDMGAEADGNHAHLTVVEIPDDVDWTIEEYDGYEHIAEKHRTWP